MAKLSFKQGTQAREARGVMAERIKDGEMGSNAKEPFALATYITKRMSKSKRGAVAARR
jgi:hypothetical protein